jgi:hypothetical protein
MDRLPKVATPLTAVTVVVPDTVAPAGLVLSTRVTALVELVTGAPDRSSIVTTTTGLNVVPAVALLGCTVKANFAPLTTRTPDPE